MIKKVILVFVLNSNHLMMDKNANPAIYPCIGVIRKENANTVHKINTLIL